MRKFAVGIALFVFVFFHLSQRVLSQSGASVVEGVVEDVTGAVIQNSYVTLVNTETGGKLTTSTNADGVYAFLSVQPGVYSLQAFKEGFKSYSIANFRVTVSQRATQNIVLGLGAASATITVDASGSGSLFEPTSNELGTLIEQQSVRDLPLNGRDFLQLGLLSGGTQTSGTTVSDFTTLQVGHPDALSSPLGWRSESINRSTAQVTNVEACGVPERLELYFFMSGGHSAALVYFRCGPFADCRF